MENIRQTLQQLVVDAVRKAPAEDIPLLAWPLACGSAVAEKTRALAFTDGELTIRVPDAAWRTQLLSLTSDYLRQLRQITEGRVERLRFVLESELEKP
jgi:predicted nucleic acid-binding Zn ribbon protein